MAAMSNEATDVLGLSEPLRAALDALLPSPESGVHLVGPGVRPPLFQVRVGAKRLSLHGSMGEAMTALHASDKRGAVLEMLIRDDDGPRFTLLASIPMGGSGGFREAPAIDARSDCDPLSFGSGELPEEA